MTEQQIPNPEEPYEDAEAELDDESHALVPIKRREAPRGFQQENTYTQNAQGRFIALPFALGLVALGGLLLVEDQIEGFSVTPVVAALLLISALVLTNLFRFFASGRRERGLFFLALMTMGIGAALAVMNVQSLEVTEWYPLTMFGIALAFFITFIFERQHERGLLGLTILFAEAGAIGLLVTQGGISDDILEQTADYFPLIIAVIGITLIPLALRRE